MRYFAVTGHPVGHSKSPDLFRGAYPGREEMFAYFRLAVTSAEEANELFQELNLDGMNITAPFKGAEHWDFESCDQVVKQLGQGNMLWRTDEGIRLGNTDVEGGRGALEASGVVLQGKRCLVVGAGGAGRAAVYALQRAGADVMVVNRTKDKARQVARDFGVTIGDWTQLEFAVSQSDVVINTLYAWVDCFQTAWFREDQVILEAAYAGSMLREKVLRAGCRYIDGRQWLLHQGIPAYRCFTGEEPDRWSMEQALTELLAPPIHVAFVGFMGAGKSTVAPLVAGALGISCVDTDRELERRLGYSVPEIMQKYGESYFREQEQLLMKELLENKKPSVIACGGGVVLSSETRQLLRQRSFVVWLYVRPEICVSRIEVATRPLLAGEITPEEKACHLFGERKSYYATVADLVVSGNERSVEELKQLIYEEVRAARNL